MASVLWDTSGKIDESLLRGLATVEDVSAEDRMATLQYFNYLAVEKLEGWRVCANDFTQKLHMEEVVRFFCLQVIEYHIRNRHASSSDDDVLAVRSLLLYWLKADPEGGGLADKPYIRSKMAQLFALVFVQDYPGRWPSFFPDLMSLLTKEEPVLDLYLRILQAIDVEITDREVTHTKEENSRNSVIKDCMRDHCVPQLVETWYHVLTLYEQLSPDTTVLAMSVVGAYVNWIDITLIANDRIIGLLLKFMTIAKLREGSCDCVHDVISKGMDGLTKVQLVESLIVILDNSRVFAMATEENDPDFVAKLARLMNGVGSALIESFHKLVKAGNEEAAGSALKAIHAKFPALLEFLGNEDDGISEEITPFAAQYVGILKNCHKGSSNWTDEDRNNLKPLLLVVINKMKYEEDYNFLSEGDKEVVFLEYRKQLKLIFDSIASLDQALVLHTSEALLLSVLGNLGNESFDSIEVVLRVFYILGEVIHCKTGHFSGPESTKSPWYRMMTAILQSGISEHPHLAVCQQYFELVIRYDKFFLTEQAWIAPVLAVFLGGNGLRHKTAHVRSRCCYFFCRFIKTIRTVLSELPSNDLLLQLQGLMTYECLEQNYLSISDQNFLFEASGYIVVYSDKTPEQKGDLMQQILFLSLEKFKQLLPQLAELQRSPEAQEVCAQRLHDLLSCASRCTKVFSNHAMAQQNGCGLCLTQGLTVVLLGLEVPVQRELLHSGVRQYLHRMILCLGDELLQHIPMAVHMMLKGCTSREIQELIPLMNQLISKYKQRIVPFLSDIFMHIVQVIMSKLEQHYHHDDMEAVREHRNLQKSYFLFLNSVTVNNIISVLETQNPAHIEQVLSTLIQGATSFPDPSTQKNCFAVLKKMVDTWGSGERLPGFIPIVYKHVVPACLEAPLKADFDLADAHNFLAIGEISSLLLSLIAQREVEFFTYLQTEYLPKLQLSPELAQHLLQTLQLKDHKTMKSQLKVFYKRVRR